MSLGTGMVTAIMDWTQLNLVPLGPFGLFSLAFMESSFFPIPPDVLLIPLVLAAPELWILYALITTIGSVTGAILGYGIGIKGGRPILERLAGKKETNKVEGYFKKYGDWAIGIAGFTPIPYKIFTIFAGMMRHNIPKLLAVSAVSRGARFFIVAGATAYFGNAIITALDQFFAGILVLILVAIGAWYLHRKYLKKKF